MDIQNKPTLEQKQAFWKEQLPNFEAKYWLPSHFEFLVFDMDQGNYVVKEDLDPIFEDDSVEIWHRVNTGWTMWKKAINFSKSQAIPEGFVLVPREPTDEMIEDFSDGYMNSLSASFKGASRDGYKAMIEAQEQGHE